jgi:hypothetical protein
VWEPGVLAVVVADMSARDPAVGVVQERGGSHQLLLEEKVGKSSVANFVGKCVCEEKEYIVNIQ